MKFLLLCEKDGEINYNNSPRSKKQLQTWFLQTPLSASRKHRCWPGESRSLSLHWFVELQAAQDEPTRLFFSLHMSPRPMYWSLNVSSTRSRVTSWKEFSLLVTSWVWPWLIAFCRGGTLKKITFGSTILTMTSWYARNLKACATVWSTLIVSGQEQESISRRSEQGLALRLLSLRW